VQGLVLTLLLLLLLVGCGHLDASEEADLHKTAHFFGSYSVNTVAYGAWKSVVKNRTAAVILAGATTAAVCAAKEARDTTFSGRDMAVCGAGVGTSTLTIISFGF
jgi:hypothetical protein